MITIFGPINTILLFGNLNIQSISYQTRIGDQIKYTHCIPFCAIISHLPFLRIDRAIDVCVIYVRNMQMNEMRRAGRDSDEMGILSRPSVSLMVSNYVHKAA